ncbi:NUDIX domain-containing protein [Streptomyces sp. NPDC014734]|uniref:NUDIX domain-containing protein n=1 Tax=Streptomyces sp. NPDC014734 TaxID=3364886 RepID=UPI0036F4CF90
MVERVDEQDQVLAMVGRGEAVRHDWLHRIAVTVCRDREGRILVQRRSEHVARFPGHYEVASGGAVAAGESYEEAADKLATVTEALGKERAVTATVRRITAELDLELHQAREELEQSGNVTRLPTPRRRASHR